MIVHIEPREWDLLVRGVPGYSFRQSMAYSQAIARVRGAQAEFVRLGGDEPDGFASVRVRRWPVPGVGVAFVSGGPLVVGGLEGLVGHAALSRCLAALIQEYVVLRRLALRIAPPLVSTASAAAVQAVFQQAGFGQSIHSPRYRTLVVDLDKPVEAIRRQLEQKWRNQLNNAERRNLNVSKDDGCDAVARFMPMFDDLRRRKDFHVELDCDFYDRVQRRAQHGSRFTVAIASDRGIDVAGAVTDLGGQTAIYLLGATSEAGMRCKAAYVLQWNVMMAARAAGCLSYDLGGIDPEENPGVYHFKVGFGGHDVTAPGPYERYPHGIAGAIARVIVRAYGVRGVLRQARRRSKDVPFRGKREKLGA